MNLSSIFQTTCTTLNQQKPLPSNLAVVLGAFHVNYREIIINNSCLNNELTATPRRGPTTVAFGSFLVKCREALSFLYRGLEEELGVAIGQETETVLHSIVIHAAPLIIADKSGYQKQQCGLRLVEVGDHAAHDAVLEAGSDHQLGAAHVAVGMVLVQVIDDVLQRLLGGNHAGCGVRHPLGNGERLFIGIGVIFQDLADVS